MAILKIKDADGTVIEVPAIRGPQGVPGQKGEKGEPGEKGEQGDPGEDGTTPHIGANGNWFVGDTDTGVAAGGGSVKTVNGIAPDENGNITLDIPTDEHINQLINTALGVIENGTY